MPQHTARPVFELELKCEELTVTRARSNRDLNSGSHNHEPSALPLGYPAIPLSRYPAIPLSRYPAIPLSRYPSICTNNGNLSPGLLFQGSVYRVYPLEKVWIEAGSSDISSTRLEIKLTMPEASLSLSARDPAEKVQEMGSPGSSDSC